MDICVNRIVNFPIASNCFVVYDLSETDKCIVIDPGTEDSSLLKSFLEEKKLFPEYVVITHEHFDHIWGVNELRKLYPSLLLVAQHITSDNIINPKKNLSLFYDGKGFSVSRADILVEESLTLKWNNIPLEFFSSPGHSKGSLCVAISNYLFVGDLIISESSPIVKLPGGDIDELYKSLEYIKEKYSSVNMILKCGHGGDMRIKDVLI